jgi:ribA/ribD-fused uncharacterized protein
MFFKEQGYEFLSNMYPCTIVTKEGAIFSCTESAYQANKIIPFDKSFTALNGFQAKKLGRKFTNIRKDWEQVKVPIMKELLELKFAKGSPLAKRLLALQEEIVEDNTWGDTFWGRCNGIGDNMLGKLLMEVRESLLD